MIAVRVKPDDNSPSAGFDLSKPVRENVYLLQVKTGSPALDNALYSLAHPDAPDAIRGATHRGVVEAIRVVAKVHKDFTDIAEQLADAYEQEYCNP